LVCRSLLSASGLGNGSLGQGELLGDANQERDPIADKRERARLPPGLDAVLIEVDRLRGRLPQALESFENQYERVDLRQLELPPPSLRIGVERQARDLFARQRQRRHARVEPAARRARSPADARRAIERSRLE